MSLNQLVLITGGNGHVGYRVLVETLKAGYAVRAAIRSSNRAEQILSAPSITALNPGSKLNFVTVPDITIPGAYDEAVRGVDFIIHVASSITQGYEADEFESKILDPAVKGTTGILKSAAQHSNIKRVVITSSAVAIWPVKKWMNGEVKDAFTENDHIPLEPGPYSSEMEAYCASKVQALHSTHDFVQKERPKYDVINLMPSFVYGKNELVTEASQVADGTNGMILRIVLGTQNPMPQGGASVHVDDVAKIHVQALSSTVDGNQDYLLSSEGPEGITFQEAASIASRDYAGAVKKGLLSENGTQPTKALRINTSKAEKAFGIRFQPFENQVKSVVDYYLQLLEKQNSRS